MPSQRRVVASQYVRLLNQGAVTVCLDGYQVQTQAIDFTIAAGTCLAPGQTWMLHGGKGSSSVNAIYLGRKKPMMYLSDTLTVLSDREQVVAKRQW